MEVSPLWRGPGDIHGFVLDGQSYRPEWATAQTLTEPAISGVRITTLILCTCNLTTTACGRWSHATNQPRELLAPHLVSKFEASVHELKKVCYQLKPPVSWCLLRPKCICIFFCQKRAPVMWICVCDLGEVRKAEENERKRLVHFYGSVAISCVFFGHVKNICVEAYLILLAKVVLP